jgi:hypothetical protein
LHSRIASLAQRTKPFYPSLERFTDLKPVRSRGKTAVADSPLQAIATGAERLERRRSMSTLSHHAQPVVRSRAALVVLATVTALVIAIALIASRGGSTDPFSNDGQPSATQTPQQQLQAKSGPRYGVDQGIVRTESPQEQLQSVAGPRYHVYARAMH